jgi:hypothetical protein
MPIEESLFLVATAKTAGWTLPNVLIIIRCAWPAIEDLVLVVEDARVMAAEQILGTALIIIRCAWTAIEDQNGLEDVLAKAAEPTFLIAPRIIQYVWDAIVGRSRSRRAHCAESQLSESFTWRRKTAIYLLSRGTDEWWCLRTHHLGRPVRSFLGDDPVWRG